MIGGIKPFLRVVSFVTDGSLEGQMLEGRFVQQN